MEILVILMLALILFAIVMFIMSYIFMKKKQVDKDSFSNDLSLDLDDDDDNNEDYFANTSVISIISDDVINSDVTNSNEAIVDKSDVIVDNIDVINPIINVDNSDIEELISVLINKKVYIFLANNNKVEKNDHVKVLLNKRVYYGLITKANYLRDISTFKIKPQKLVLIKNDDKKSSNSLDEEDSLNDEFLPKRKNK